MIVIVRPFINVFLVDMNSLITRDVRPIPVVIAVFEGEGFQMETTKNRYGNIFPQDFMMNPDSSYLFFFRAA